MSIFEKFASSFAGGFTVYVHFKPAVLPQIASGAWAKGKAWHQLM
jgi:hypothetical protein